jgi:hypothetical protein
MRIHPAFLLALALGLLTGATGHASTVLHQDLRGLTLGSSDIVVGRVEATRAHWNESRTRIVTEVTVSVGESLKGAGGERLTLVQPGGEADGFRYAIAGAPAFRPGEEALLFVWRDRQGRAQVNGLSQGKFEIATDAATGERTVQRLAAGAAVADVTTLSPLKQGQVAPRLRLADLTGAIRRILAEAGR